MMHHSLGALFPAPDAVKGAGEAVVVAPVALGACLGGVALDLVDV